MNSNFKTRTATVAKYNINAFALAILTAFCFYSCEKTVEFDVDTQVNKLVVNCLFGSDSDVEAIVSLSSNPLDIEYNIEYVENAKIQLFRNGDYLGEFSNTDSLYLFENNLFDTDPGDIFRIEASAPGRESVNAETVIPDEVLIVSLEVIDTIYQTVSYLEFDTLLGTYVYIDSLLAFNKFEITFNDPAGTNYYSLEVLYEDLYSSTYTCWTTSDPAFLLDNQFGNSDGETTLCGEVDFTDQTFNGETKKIQFILLQLETEFTTDPKFVFKLRHLSEDYYKYLTSYQLQVNNNDDPFGEPVIVFSNIENGFGIFAGYSISEKTVEL